MREYLEVLSLGISSLTFIALLVNGGRFIGRFTTIVSGHTLEIKKLREEVDKLKSDMYGKQDRKRT